MHLLDKLPFFFISLLVLFFPACAAQYSPRPRVFDALLDPYIYIYKYTIIFGGWPGREAHAGDGVSVRASES